jgi:predicted esterase
MIRRLASLTLCLVATNAACSDDDAATGGGGGDATTSSSSSATTSASSGEGGGDGCASLECGPDGFCYAGECRACDAPTGTRRDVVLTLGDGMEDREYFIHVPASYDCSPAPLLVDFHGTAGGPRPEEAYQNDAVIDLSEAESVITVRPRSRSSERGGFGEIFRWDQNPGDLDRNVTFTVNLVEALRQTYNIDAARIYASGFSSGANMTSQLLGGETAQLFSGYAPIAGGYWNDPNIAPYGADPPRVYVATGYRDYLFSTARDLLVSLDDAGLPADRIFFRETDTGHDLYAWHFPEIFAWLDRGERPAAGSVAAPWAEEVVPTEASFVAAARTAGGDIVATTADGEILLRDAAGAWSVETVAPDPIAWTGVCVDESAGDVFAVGEGRIVKRVGGVWSAPAYLPDLGDPTFGYGYINGIACTGAGSVAGVGYWEAMRTSDAGANWTAWGIPAGPGYQAQASGLAVGPSGTLIAVGYYDYVGRSTGGDLVASPHQAVAEWWNDVAAGPGGLFLVVGDTGAVNRSTDDGLTWFSASVPADSALYAVAIGPDGSRAAAAGLGGQVIYTADGGSTWDTLPTGQDRFVGAIVFLDDDTVLLLGERGSVLRADLPS